MTIYPSFSSCDLIENGLAFIYLLEQSLRDLIHLRRDILDPDASVFPENI